MPEESKVVETESDSSRNAIYPRYWDLIGCLIGNVIAIAFGVDWKIAVILAIVETFYWFRRKKKGAD